jgi:hypothetical protein
VEAEIFADDDGNAADNDAGPMDDDEVEVAVEGENVNDDRREFGRDNVGGCEEDDEDVDEEDVGVKCDEAEAGRVKADDGDKPMAETDKTFSDMGNDDADDKDCDAAIIPEGAPSDGDDDEAPTEAVEDVLATKSRIVAGRSRAGRLNDVDKIKK